MEHLEVMKLGLISTLLRFRDSSTLSWGHKKCLQLNLHHASNLIVGESMSLNIR